MEGVGSVAEGRVRDIRCMTRVLDIVQVDCIVKTEMLTDHLTHYLRILAWRERRVRPGVSCGDRRAIGRKCGWSSH